ncbi:MAG TPA: cytochrome P450 [Microlunatus sp.]|nr:cytochrome P450 [Microlunatus sp.]
MTPATDELDHVLADRVVTAGDLAALPWTGRAVREAMWLYPAAHSIGRSNTHEEMLNGYRIPAGSAIVVSPWTIHRSPKSTRATVGGGYRRSLTGSKPRSDPAPTGRRAWRVFT